jgi:DnaJ-domain-containing protein 1
MQFDKDNAALFHENAEQDCTAILDAVNYILTQDDADSEHQYDPEAGYQSFHNSATNESHSDYRDAHDNNNQSTSDSVNNTYTYISDYEELGLDATASWDDVGAAYRKICKQYHPDVLASQQIPARLMELAVTKFKAATDAYQRLRSQIGGQRRAEPAAESDVVLCPYCGQKNRVGWMPGNYRCGRCGYGISGESEEAETEEPYEGSVEHEEDYEDENDLIDEDIEHITSLPLVEFCEACQECEIVIKAEGDTEDEVLEWYNNEEVVCRSCGKCYLVRGLVDWSEIRDCIVY